MERLISGERKFGRKLWGLLCLELWFQAFVDGDYLKVLTPQEEAGVNIGGQSEESVGAES